MSLKNRDEHNRWRNKTVAFRVSPEEWEQIERYVQLSGLTKQDYITRRLINKEVVVQGNPRVYKALRNNLANVLMELQRIENGSEVNDECLTAELSRQSSKREQKQSYSTQCKRISVLRQILTKQMKCEVFCRSWAELQKIMAVP